MEQKNNWLANIVYYLAWLICSILVIVDLLVVREASLVVSTAIQSRHITQSAPGEKIKTLLDTGSALRAIDQGFIFVGGVVGVVLAIAIEYYFRLGKQKGKLLQRIGLVLAIQVGIFIACVLIQTFV